VFNSAKLIFKLNLVEILQLLGDFVVSRWPHFQTPTGVVTLGPQWGLLSPWPWP